MSLLAYYQIFWSVSSLWEFHTHVYAIKEWRVAPVKKLVTVVFTEERSSAVNTGRQILCTDDLPSRFAAGIVGVVVDFSLDPSTVLLLYFLGNYCFSVAWDAFAGGDSDVEAVMCIAWKDNIPKHSLITD